MAGRARLHRAPWPLPARWLAAAVLTAACSPSPSLSPSSIAAPPDGDFPNPPPAAPAAWTTLEQKQLILGGTFGGQGSQFITGATAFRGGFVVIGYTFVSDQDVTGRIWRSPNGSDWSSVDDPKADLEGAEIAWIGTDGRTLLAIGGKRPTDATTGPPPVVWSSSDGVTWRRVAEAPRAMAEIGINGIVGQEGVFIAIGGTADGKQRLLRTSDGVDWTAIETSAFDASQVVSVVPYRGGWLAVGATAREGAPMPGGRPEPARAWWSIDGLHWWAAQVAEGPSLTTAYPGAEAIFGTGSSDCGSCVSNANLWQSDGKAWRLLGPDRLMWPMYASDGSRIVAWDFQGAGGFGWSADGMTWHPFGDPLKDARAFGGLVVGRDGLLLPLSDGNEPADAGVLYLAAG